MNAFEQWCFGLLPEERRIEMLRHQARQQLEYEKILEEERKSCSQITEPEKGIVPEK